MVKPLTTMLMKDMMFTKTKEGKASFEEINKSIASAMVKPLTTMLKKDVIFTWTIEGKDNF